MTKNFDFKSVEPELYKKWQDREYFKARVNPDKKPYTVIMPPPNVTDKLHLGHAYCLAIQDMIVRFKRMQGFETLYLPGSDHAAIATEVKVVESLKKRGIAKKDLSREQFIAHVEEWYKIYIAEQKNQITKMGLSCDWSRYTFTKDEKCAVAVDAVFKHFNDKGMIYKGPRMVLMCLGCKSSIDEIEHKQVEQSMYYIKYDDITVATVRPETIYGDVAVAVHPKDKRYTKFIGKTVTNPLTGKQIPVIADEYVDMKFGTGALKITPAHDAADYEIGVRHNLEIITVEDLSKAARARAIEILREKNLIIDEKKYTSTVTVCDRCKSQTEPTISTQWFVRMETLKHKMLCSIPDILPKKYLKTYMHWVNNLKDWCISRQLTSGYRIPIDGETDVLDTWFSSALWPFCTLGWPNDTPDFKYFYPTQTLVTGFDIILFWVVRMVFSGLEHTGKLPFERVLFHGLVRDAEGRKMSKSLGNGIDPVAVIDQFGVDALRFSIIAGTKLDRDPRYSMDKATLARNFINKFWNAVKFYRIIETVESEFNIKKQRPEDKEIIKKLNSIVKSTTRKYEKFDFGVAANDLQQFFWHEFCDIYIEQSKDTKNPEVFKHVLTTFLKLISPIMPFVAEHIWCDVLEMGETIMFEEFPK